ncbi:hypothetical protein BKA64DRAFT_470051 [Cadophora sp. MPI-SDFR-AT-0126]|nr:hypothetical protein BKA64DRAFT_470051 [Leotiomycetes sp. MPI-SDFR-AT-0126]
MTSRRRTTSCLCTRSLHLSSAVLFLSAILPSSSFAQITDPASSNPSNIATSLTQTPSTLQTQTPTSIPPSSTSNASPSPTQSSSPSTTPIDGDNNGRNSNGMFNYYFIIVAIVVILFVITMLYIGKRKKRKAAIMRSNSQRALAQDVEGLRNRFGMGRGAMRRAHAGGLGTGVGDGRGAGAVERTEGLNERGEAPPPYRPGSKPPSLRSSDGVAVREVPSRERDGGEQAVEMDTIVRPTPTSGQDPPGYHEEINGNGTANNGGNESWADLEMTRPTPAVTAPPRRDTSTE